MNTEPQRIEVSGLVVEVLRKHIRTLRLAVYPPDGRVRVSAPLRASDEAVRQMVAGKLDWIKRHQARFAARPPQVKHEMVSGESHYFLGTRYRLQVTPHTRQTCVLAHSPLLLELCAHPDSSTEERERVLQLWYRRKLSELIPPLLEKWQQILAVQAAQWGVKRMKTRWGSCNVKARRIWLSLELAKKSMQCLEYIVVHELMHLLERRHGKRFAALMDQHMPAWRQFRIELNHD